VPKNKKFGRALKKKGLKEFGVKSCKPNLVMEKKGPSPTKAL